MAKIEEKDFSFKRNNLDMLLETHVSMFDYGNMPDSVNIFFLEKFLQTQSMVCWLKDNDDLIVASCSLAGDLDPYGIGRNVVAVTRNGKSFQLKRGKDCVIGYNNRTMTACGDIFTDADMLAEIQTSIEFLIFWTRLSPLVRTTDDKMRLKVVEAFKNIRKGIPVTIVSKKLLAEFGDSDEISIDMLTQPDFADKIQYTAKLYDDALRWHMTRYGHATNGNSKAAQQTVDEVDSTASQSMILPLSMLFARRKMIEEVNAMFGTDITVELSGAWRAEVTAYEIQSGEASIDNSSDDLAPAAGQQLLASDDVIVSSDVPDRAPTDPEQEENKTAVIEEQLADIQETVDKIEEEISDDQNI